jgi:hypothetical protein
VELQSELQQALDVLIDDHENVEMPFQSNVMFIVAYVEVRECRIFKSTFICRLNGKSTSSKDRFTQFKAIISYMKPKLLMVANHVIMLNLGW